MQTWSALVVAVGFVGLLFFLDFVLDNVIAEYNREAGELEGR